MNYTKQQAKEALDELHNSIPYDKYCAIHDGLTEIELLRDRDEELEELWECPLPAKIDRKKVKKTE